MSAIVAEQSSSRHRTLGEIPKAKQAKADLTFRETRQIEADFRAEVGQAVQRAISLVGWSVKEAADHIGRERAQVSRWIAGTETPQFAKLWTLGERFQQELVIALAELVPCVSVRTQITLERKGA